MTSKRILLLGAETELGAEVSRALGEAGHVLALISGTTDPEAAFSVQRLARKFIAVSQAIDAENGTAVRVMVRQVAKQLGGIDAAVMCADSLSMDFETYATRQMEKDGGGLFVSVTGMKYYGELQRGPEAGPPLPPSSVRRVEVNLSLTQSLGSPPTPDVDDLISRVVLTIAGEEPTP